ncbi:response regulator, partial [Streptomyces atacamensis]
MVAASPILGGSAPPEAAPRQRALPMPGSETAPSEQTSGVSVRTLGQGVPFARQSGEQHTGQHAVQPPAPPAPHAPATPLAPAAPPVPPAPQPPAQAPAPGPA